MEFTPVKSSNIAAIGHDAETGRLHVRFKSGDHYAYDGVPEDFLPRVLASNSIGRFLAGHVKGKFEFKQLELEAARGQDYLAESDQAADAAAGHDGAGERVLRDADQAGA